MGKLRATSALAIVAVILAISALVTKADLRSSESNSIEAAESGLFEYIWKPLKSTYDRAKSFLGDDSNQNLLMTRAFQLFLNLYNKTYPPEELARRAQLFFERRKWIQESMERFREGRDSFAMRENAFADWDEQELKKLTGVSLPSLQELSAEAEAQQVDSADENEDPKNLLVLQQSQQLPSSKDWRESGCVSEPINQMKCGACYAIATMSVVETMRCLDGSSSPILSAQQIVDCATPRAGYQNFGCDGGWPTRVLKYLQDTGLASKDSCYPFVRRQNACQLNRLLQTKSDSCIVNASPTNRRKIQYKVLNNERDILMHVAQTGPVVTVMKASSKFLYYGRGIFDDPSCSRRRDDVDHAIVIVGYGRENNVDYWLIKNSWGTSTWGEGGYAKYRRGSNVCSIGHWAWVVTG